MMMREQIEHVLAEVRASWRFRWYALVVAWLVCLAGWSVIFLLPDSFESRAQIYVDTTSILKPLLQGIAVSPDSDDATDAVQRALLARPTLEKVARKTRLILRAQTPEQAERFFAKLQKQIGISGSSKTSIYTIHYSDRDPRMAQAVVQTLLDTFVQDSLGISRTDTQDAQRFLRQEVSTYEARLSQAEQRLADFKKKYIGLMPDEHGDYFNRLQTEQIANEKLRTDLDVALQQRDELRRKIAGTVGDKAAPPPPPTDRQIQAATALDAQIQESKRQLDALLLKFTDKHPDVIALRETIRQLEERRSRELGGVRATTAVTQGGTGAPGVDPVLQSLQIQLNDADVQIAALQTRVSQSNARIAELRKLLNTTPEVEAELSRLNRDYGVTKSEYEALLQRLESAKISANADRSQDARFQVLDPPRVPIRPTAPRRILMMAAVLLLGLAAGGGAAYGLNCIRPVFVTSGALTKALELPALGVVSHFESAAAAAVLRRDRAVLVSVTGLLLAAFAASVAFSHAGSKLLRSGLGLE
jgi:polysaccharide chain length determinant protein (PEP-CTERM system associated)